jgi:outer membrane protein assembly factor BamA
VRVRAYYLRNLCAFLLAAAFLLSAVSAHAQAQTPSGTAKLASIEIVGSTKLTNAQATAASGLKIGDIVGKEDLQKAADKLGALGVFTSISYRYTTDASGVHLVFEAKDASGVPVVFDNFPWFTDEELNSGIRTALGSFDGTAPQQGAILDRISSALEALLPTKGVRGQVQHTLIEWPDSSGSVMQFSVEGNPVLLKNVTFTDSIATKSLAVSAQLSDVVGHPYSRLAIALYAFDQVRPVYFEVGYLKVSFGTPTAVINRSPNGRQDDSVGATLPVKLGTQYHFGGITWSGNSTYSVTSLSSMIPMPAGSIVNGNRVQAAWATITNSYAHVGYMDAVLDPQATFDDAEARVSYHVQITEGPQYHMGDLIITGLSLDGEKRLRQAWTLTKGEVFDQAYFDNFVTRIAKPTDAIYGNVPVHYDKVGQLARRNEQTHVIDVLFDFQ